MLTELSNDLSIGDDRESQRLMSYWLQVCVDLEKVVHDNSTLQALKVLVPYEMDGARFILSAPTRFVRDRIKNKFTAVILEYLQKHFPQILTVEVIVGRQKTPNILDASSNALSDNNLAVATPVLTSQETAKETHKKNDTIIENNNSFFDEKYTFSNFIVGPSNELAFAAARKVAEGRPVTFNPLFFHGGVGLGKTHLMHAIALEIEEKSPEKEVLYLSAEQFMHRFIVALRNKDTQTFKEQFRNVDVLMIDDLQFIAGKTQTQEEFFHTFNALVDSKKQIIISADRSPNDMGNMEDRIRSRLGWGLVVDIHQTDYSLRVGILRSKIALLQNEYPSFFIPDKVIDYLAHRITGNVRELEGAVNRIAAHATFTGRPVTMELTEEIIFDLLRVYEKKTGVNEIRRKICDYFNIKPTDLDSSRRSRDIAYPRQVAMYLTKSLTGLSYPEIGRKFGGKDHSTVIHAVHRIEIALNESNEIAEQIKELKNLLKTP